MTNKNVIDRAKDFCDDNGINSYPVKIVELCEKQGIKVFEEYLPKEVSGFIIIQEDNFRDYDTGKLIVINLSDSARRRRFTIAHELAHYLLHRDTRSELYAHRDAGQNNRMEQEANLFAANILMPEDLVKKALENISDDSSCALPPSMKIEYIANEFAVSFNAALVRMEQLKLCL